VQDFLAAADMAPPRAEQSPCSRTRPRHPLAGTDLWRSIVDDVDLVPRELECLRASAVR
jgi:hypothetical protein